MSKKLLRRISINVLGYDLGVKVWSRMEIIGDIVVIKKPFNIGVDVLKPIAEEILKRLPYIKSVWCGVSEVKGQFRLREFIHLAGEPRSETIYKEHGCKFKVDIRRVYVSQRLNAEHIRVARLVREGEVVVNMFAGVGLFSIIIAKHSKASKIYSIDINPYAYKLMVENVKINHVEDRVYPILGDAKDVITRELSNIADRVLMPLPELVHEYLKYAILSLRKNGYLHLYDFIGVPKGEDPIRRCIERFDLDFKSLNLKNYAYTNSRIVRSVGPRRYQIAVDVYIEK